MKIKLLGLTKDLEQKGFKIDNTYNILKISISRDPTAYDVFYQVKSERGTLEWLHDLLVEEIDFDKKYLKMLEQFDQIEIPYKFNFEIIL